MGSVGKRNFEQNVSFGEIQAPQIANFFIFKISEKHKFQFWPISEAKKSSLGEIQAPKIEKHFVFDISKEQKFQFWPV